MDGKPHCGDGHTDRTVVMDYRIRKVPRDVLLLCMAGTVLYQAVTRNVDWKVSLGGGLIGMIFLGISKITGKQLDTGTVWRF